MVELSDRMEGWEGVLDFWCWIGGVEGWFGYTT